jgi:hypothetical protein
MIQLLIQALVHSVKRSVADFGLVTEKNSLKQRKNRTSFFLKK